MFNWFDRWQERQRELFEGADANLLLDVRRQRIRAWLLIACGSSLALILRFAEIPVLWKRVGGAVLFLLIFAGGLLLRWASMQDNWLRLPDPEDPPSILKGK